MDFVADLALVLLAALVGGFVAQRFGQPLIVGYILAGLTVGPFTAGPTVGNVHHIEQLAELGVALLLFSLGLEMSLRELKPVRAVALGGTLIQIVLTMAFGFGLSRAFGWGWLPAIWFGAVVALSSTMVALKTLQAQGRLGTLSARVMLGILVVQDLAVVPLMIVLPQLGAAGGSVTAVMWAAGRAALILGAIVLLSTRIVPRVMAFVARGNSHELFFLATMTVAVGVGYVAWFFGLSLAIGAFIAGLIVSESEYAHQALSDIIPLRDLFGMLFFVSVGMLLDPRLLWQQISIVAATVALVSAGKAIILAAVVRVFGYRRIVPLAVGLTLFQVGEFAFVLAGVGRSAGALPPELYALVLNTAIVTMALTPMISRLVPAIYRRTSARTTASDRHERINLPASGFADHLVIAGAGRVGRAVATVVSTQSVPLVLIEFDDRRVRQARADGLPLIYGDATQAAVLEAAGVGRARAMVITAPALADVSSIVRSVRAVRPDLAIVARAEGPEAAAALVAIGIEATSPEVEGAREMARQALHHFTR